MTAANTRPKYKLADSAELTLPDGRKVECEVKQRPDGSYVVSSTSQLEPLPPITCEVVYE